MTEAILISIRAMAVFTLLTGFAYPFLTLGIGQVVFPHQANGSRIYRDGKLAGSELIGRNYDKPEYFWPRPSATSPGPYNAASSSGSNFGPLHPDRLKPQTGVPLDLRSTSASGLDPHISPEAALYQSPRVAQARHYTIEQLRSLIDQHTEPRQFGVLGEPRVNVLTLNLALDLLWKK